MSTVILQPEIPMQTKAGKPLTAAERAVRRWQKRNPEKIKEYKQRYVATHKEEIQKYQLGKVTCDCGITVSRVNLSPHRRSQRHQKWQEQQQQI